MSRVRTLFVTALPSAIIGGFLFASAFGHAETGRDGALGFWPSASDSATGRVLVAQADPEPRQRPPIPPAPPAPPAPPTVAPPPLPPGVHVRTRHGHGISMKIRDGKIEVDGIVELVQEQLDKLSSALDGMTDAPPEARERLRNRLRAVKEKISARLGRLKTMDLDKLDRLGPEVERLGEEIAREMEGLDKDFAQFGEQFGKDFSRKFSKSFGHGPGFGPGAGPIPGPGPGAVPAIRQGSEDSDDDDDEDDDEDAVVVRPGDRFPDPGAMAPAIAALDNLGLDPAQRVQLAKLRAQAETDIDNAKRELERRTNQLHEALARASVDEADIARQIDDLSRQEAALRKARILTWIKARNLLRADQRQRIEAASRRSH